MIIRPAQESDIPGMVELLHGYMNPKFSIDRWSRLFQYDWCPDRPDLGRVAVVDGHIVGCIAAVYSDRWINGRRERFVNPAAWYLRREYRREMVGAGKGLGYSLMEDLVADPNYHYHINTSSKYTTQLLVRLGFSVLDDAKYVWRSGGARKSRSQHLAVMTDRFAIADAVPVSERQLLCDHDRFELVPMRFEAEGHSCLIIFASSIKSADELWLDALYVSDPAFFARWGGEIANFVLSEPGMFMAADCRFSTAPPQGAERVPLEVARYAKSDGLASHCIDHLYSEVQLLGQKLR